MARKSYTTDEVLKSLNRNRDIKVNVNRKVIQVLRDNNTVGNGSWGKIDFLVNFNGWRSMLVNDFDDGKPRLSKTKKRNK